jgi:hypothetical protein
LLGKSSAKENENGEEVDQEDEKANEESYQGSEREVIAKTARTSAICLDGRGSSP